MILISQDGQTTVKPEAVTMERAVKGLSWRIYAWIGGHSFPMSSPYMKRCIVEAIYREIQTEFAGDGTYRINLPEENGEVML